VTKASETGCHRHISNWFNFILDRGKPCQRKWLLLRRARDLGVKHNNSQLVILMIGQRFTRAVILAVALSGCATAEREDLAEAWQYMLAEDYLGARDAYELILLHDPTNPYAHLNLGFAYQQLEMYEAARPHYESAVEYGGTTSISQVVEEGQVKSVASTVADKGRENLATLPN